MSINNLYPDISPSLLLDFANVKKLDSRITFSRPTTAVVYDGQTVTKAEENLFSYSEDFTNSIWIKSSVSITANSTTAPDGTTTANTLTENGANAPHQLYSISTSQGIQYCFSIFVKSNGRTIVAMRGSFAANNNWISAQFDLTGVTATLLSGSSPAGTNTSATITNVGNGWYRCSYVFSPASGHITSTTRFFLSDGTALDAGSGVPIYAGDGTSGVYIWGAQLEQRDSVTPYTPTITQPITNYIPTLLTVPANTARFDHNPITGESLGLLVEEQRTNLLTYSEDFSNGSWIKAGASITNNTSIAPDGTLTADTLTVTATNYSAAFKYVSLSGTHTLQCFVKKITAKYAAVYLINPDGGTVIFDLDTGLQVYTEATVLNSSIENVGNGWYKISVTASNINRAAVFASSSAVDLTSTIGESMYIWGAQLEAGEFPTSYIKTEASQVTRSADSASMTGANFSDWYRQDEGVLFVDVVKVDPAVNRFAFGLGYNSSNYIGSLYQSGQATYIRPSVVASAFANTFTTNQLTKVAIGYKTANYASCINGVVIANTTASPTPSGTDGALYFGTSPFTPSQIATSYFRKLAYYPQRLTNENLQALTS
jgi:hypothetical protein